MIKILFLLFFYFLFFFACSNEALLKSQDENKKLQEKNNELKIENTKLSTKLEYIEKELNKTTDELNKLKEEYQKVSKQRDELLISSTAEGSKLKILEERVKALNDQIAQLENTKKSLEEETKKLKTDGETNIIKQKEQLAKAEAELQALKSKLELAEMEKKRITDQSQRENTPADTTQSDNRIEEIKKAIVEKENQIAKLKEELEKQRNEYEKQRKSYEEMISKLQKEIKEGNIQTSIQGREVRMTLKEKVMFASASIYITDKGKEILRKIGEELKKLQYGMIYVEGHTDSDRVVGWRLKQSYPTNWEFSVMRATSVVRFLIEQTGIDPKRIIAAGRSKYLPVDTNQTESGKAKNRRIEIYVMPELKPVNEANIPR